MNILGIHGGVTISQHDAAAVLIQDGTLVCAVEEERLYRVKGATGLLPIESIQACLREAKISIEDIDYIALPGETYEDLISRTRAWLIHHFGHAPELRPINHQLAHLASAYFHSGYDDAMCLSYDAFGDRLSCAMGVANKKDGINVLETRDGDNSLGVFYGAMTSFLGFKPGEDEFKVMGLAPYGNANIDLSFFAKTSTDGYFVDRRCYRDQKSASQFEPFYSKIVTSKLGQPRRKGEKLSQYHIDVAASVQKTLEDMVVSTVTYLHNKTGKDSLCLAGGVALNCSANRIINELPFIKNFFVQPAASDRGLALGCALQMSYEVGEPIHGIDHVFYGPSYSKDNIIESLKITGMKYREISNPSDEASQLLANGNIVGWHQGRSEYGPRALGHRSILADPSRANMKDEINSRVKFREEFRPFAPSVMIENASDVFEINKESPYMTMAYNVNKSWIGELPAITHINNTARVQTVSKDIDPMYHQLINKFYSITNSPVVLNTSFNIRGQPIVETPFDAISTFAGTGIDALIIDNFLLEKN
jgi:carbamoyltransferase